jgi:hypothetical protein
MFGMDRMMADILRNFDRFDNLDRFHRFDQPPTQETSGPKTTPVPLRSGTKRSFNRVNNFRFSRTGTLAKVKII